LLHAPTSGLRYRWLDHFEVRDFDDRVMRAAADRKRQVDQIAIGLWAATAVGDEEGGGVFRSRGIGGTIGSQCKLRQRCAGM
jgi:hypothetical protein